MELVAEKESDQQNNNNNSEKNNNTSYAQALVDSHESDEFRERQARDLKAGLHPLKVFSLLSVYIIYIYWPRFVHLPKIVVFHRRIHACRADFILINF